MKDNHIVILVKLCLQKTKPRFVLIHQLILCTLLAYISNSLN